MEDVDDQNFLNKLAEDYDEHKGKLQELGETALRKSLTDHFTTDNPDNPRKVADLVEFYLSRYCLIKVFESLMTHKLILVRKVRNESPFQLAKDGHCISLQNIAIFLGVSSFEKLDAGVLKKSFKKLGVDIKVPMDVTSRSLGYAYLKQFKGFRAGMNGYALQVAGLMYVVCLRDNAKFWENFKSYVNFIEPEKFQSEEQSAKDLAKDLEKDLKYAVEMVPFFCSCVTSTIK